MKSSSEKGNHYKPLASFEPSAWSSRKMESHPLTGRSGSLPQAQRIEGNLSVPNS